MDSSMGARAPFLHVWLVLVPPRVKAFCWLAIAAKVAAVDNLRIRGMMSDDLVACFSLCGKDGESVNHVFLHCDYATHLWGYFLRRCGLLWCFPCSLYRWKSGR
eukprot:TRINITY_DN40286_c0_g2_i1.p1 TRINITY_DN40286_c0_g2~~TRINITY_DN40286_c0_g2_i1.p1  ORF type:complete len:104 (-),score=14.39 TRINITY_DN40286_c0_g2_i1:780-1091(-)